MQLDITQYKKRVRVAFALQLFLSHALAGGSALGSFWLLEYAGVPVAWSLLLALLIAGVCGVILTGNIQYSLYILDLTLARFAQGLPVEPLSLLWRWPLTVFFAHINAVSLRVKALSQQEERTGEFRERVLRQASEAAALAERNRIARDLHDSIKQQIFSISISAAAAKAHSKANTADALEAIADIQRSAQEAQVEMQALLQQLRASPLENTSLADALRTQAEALGYRTSAQVVVEIADLPAADRLLPGAQEAIFRMVQETFANIARHARAQNVHLSLYQQDEGLHIEVSDDGQGFNVAMIHKGMGLANLRERSIELNGSLSIQSTAGQGTIVHAVIPLLDTLRAKMEQTRIANEQAQALEQAKSNLQLVENAAPIALVFMGANIFTDISLNLSFLTVVFCALVACYGYWQGQLCITQVALSAGKTSTMVLSLRVRERKARLWLMRFCIMVGWFLFIAMQGWQSPFTWYIIGIGTALLCVMYIIMRGMYCQAQDEYYASLALLERREEIAQRYISLKRRLRFWVLTVVLFVLVNKGVFSFPPATSSDWGRYVWLISLPLWGVLMLVDYAQVRRWQQLLLTEEQTQKVQEVCASG